MPAITVVNFGDGLADPDLILGTGIRTLSANNCGRPVWGGQRHHRHQPGARHEMVVIEDRRRRDEPMGHLHRKCLSDLAD
jgi:hypothetical protein